MAFGSAIGMTMKKVCQRKEIIRILSDRLCIFLLTDLFLMLLFRFVTVVFTGCPCFFHIHKETDNTPINFS